MQIYILLWWLFRVRGKKKKISFEVVLSDAEREWQDFVSPLRCSRAQVAAPGAAQLLRRCMGHSTEPTRRESSGHLLL